MWSFPYLHIDSEVVHHDWEGMIKAFEWLERLKHVPQEPAYHGEGNVLNHVKKVLDSLIFLDAWRGLAMEEKHILFTAALFHDVGKWMCTNVQEGKIVSTNHARKGAEFSRVAMWKGIPDPVPFHVRENVAGLVRFHSLPVWFVDRKDHERVLIRLSQSVNVNHLAMLAEADVKGRISSDREELLSRIELFREEAISVGCLDRPFPFASARARFVYLQKPGSSPYFDPYAADEFEVILMSGLPGAGKDTWIESQGLPYPVVSLDKIRNELKVSPSGKQHKVIQMAKDTARGYLRVKQPFIWNATNTTRALRRPLIDLFVSYGATVRIVYVEPPYTRLLHQNRCRTDRVPDHVLESLIDKLEVPTLEEAHQVSYIID